MFRRSSYKWADAANSILAKNRSSTDKTTISDIFVQFRFFINETWRHCPEEWRDPVSFFFASLEAIEIINGSSRYYNVKSVRFCNELCSSYTPSIRDLYFLIVIEGKIAYRVRYPVGLTLRQFKDDVFFQKYKKLPWPDSMTTDDKKLATYMLRPLIGRWSNINWQKLSHQNYILQLLGPTLNIDKLEGKVGPLLFLTEDLTNAIKVGTRMSKRRYNSNFHKKLFEQFSSKDFDVNVLVRRLSIDGIDHEKKLTVWSRIKKFLGL